MAHTPTSPSAQRPANPAKLTRAERRALSAPVGWWRYSPVLLQQTSKGVRLRVFWGKAAAALGMLAVMAWLGGASSAYLFVKYKRHFPEVRFSHMLLYPWRKEEYRAARGAYLIEEGKKLVQERKLREAFYSLRVGLGLTPRDRDGRMLLAQFFAARQYPDFAQSTLVEGLPFHRHDFEYLQALFNFLLQQQQDAVVIEITGDLLAEADAKPQPEKNLKLIAMARANALFFRGNYDAAEDALRKFRLLDSSEGRMLALRIDWERGDTEAALARLEALALEQPDNEQIYGQHAAYLREAERVDDLRRLAVLRQLSYPDRPRARIDLLYLHDKAGNEQQVQLGISELFRDFSTNTEVMLALADFAANTGRAELARRIYELSKANELAWEGPALMMIEAHVVAKNYREALAASADIQKDNPEWAERVAPILNGLHAIANFGLGNHEAGQLALTNFLNESGARADNLVAVSNRLVSVNAFEPARQVLLKAVQADPLNQIALTGLIRIELDGNHAESASQNLRALLAMRKPPRTLLTEAYQKLGSDRFILAPGRAGLLDQLRKTIDSASVGEDAT